MNYFDAVFFAVFFSRRDFCIVYSGSLYKAERDFPVLQGESLSLLRGAGLLPVLVLY